MPLLLFFPKSPYFAGLVFKLYVVTVTNVIFKSFDPLPEYFYPIVRN